MELVEGSLTLNDHSCVPGASIGWRVGVPAHVRVDRVQNVKLNFHRVEDLRDQFAFSFATLSLIVDGMLSAEATLPIELAPGIYRADSPLLLLSSEGGSSFEFGGRFFGSKWRATLRSYPSSLLSNQRLG